MHFICYSVEPMVGRTAYFGVPEGVRLSFFLVKNPALAAHCCSCACFADVVRRRHRTQ